MIKAKKEKTANIMNNLSMHLFIMLCGYIALVLILYSICQILKLDNCLGVIQILSIIIPCIIYTQVKEKPKEKLIILLIYLSLLLVLPFLWGTTTFDLSSDGNSYHKTAIAFIKNGWNPLYEDCREFQENNPNVVPIGEEARLDLWIEHYPKATWILAATTYKMTGDIESGKVITLYFIVILLIISYNCLRTILDKKWSFIISLLVSFNPIVFGQIFSYYVDGIMGLCFTIELLLLFIVKPMEKQNKLLWLSLLGITTFFCNIKFTGLLCSGLIAAVFYFYWFFKYKKEKDFWLRFRNITFHFILVFVTAIFLVGANSYVRNLVEHKNPLYPLIGKDKVDIITSMQPPSFAKRGMGEKFVISLFSRTANITYDRGEPILKLPFRLYASEVGELLATDVRIGGFGPFYALTIIISLILFIISSYLLIKNEKKNLKYITLPLIAIVLSMILVGENWWARYVPQFYLFPIGTLVLTIYTAKYYKKDLLSKLLSIVLLGILTLNMGTYTYALYKNVQSFYWIKKDLYELKRMDNPEIKLVQAPDLYGYLYNLKDNNIEYALVEKIEEENVKYYYNKRIEVKTNEKLSKTN